MHACGLIGVGLLGTALHARLGVAWGWDTDPSRCFGVASLAEGLVRAETLFLCLPTSAEVEAALGTAPLRPGQCVIDLTTGEPAAAAATGARLAERGIDYLEATVSGSSAQLARGEALLMVGGPEAVFTAALPLLQALADEVVFVGPWGSATRLKLVTNLVLGLNRAALAEGLVLAEQLGLDGAQALTVLRQSMAYSKIMDTKGEKMLQRDYTPQARLAQHLKDVHLMRDASALPLPLTEAHQRILERAIALGYADADNAALIEALRHPQLPPNPQ